MLLRAASSQHTLVSVASLPAPLREWAVDAGSVQYLRHGNGALIEVGRGARWVVQAPGGSQRAGVQQAAARERLAGSQTLRRLYPAPAALVNVAPLPPASSPPPSAVCYKALLNNEVVCAKEMDLGLG